MWILLVTSMFGVFVWPIELVFTQVFQGYMLWVSVLGYLDVLQYDNDSYYIFDIGILLFLSNFYTWLIMNVFMINLWFPILGPIVNYILMGWVFIEW